jgi:hypothetical protein
VWFTKPIDGVGNNHRQIITASSLSSFKQGDLNSKWHWENWERNRCLGINSLNPFKWKYTQKEEFKNFSAILNAKWDRHKRNIPTAHKIQQRQNSQRDISMGEKCQKQRRIDGMERR